MTKKVLVFGVFDKLHEGHIHFLLEAKKLGEFLVVAVAHDSTVKRLKGKEPSLSSERRITLLKRLEYIDEVILGDEEEGSWNVIKTHRPDIVALGYDQDELKRTLGGLAKEFGITIRVLNPYEPDKLHSSLLG